MSRNRSGFNLICLLESIWWILWIVRWVGPWMVSLKHTGNFQVRWFFIFMKKTYRSSIWDIQTEMSPVKVGQCRAMCFMSVPLPTLCVHMSWRKRKRQKDSPVFAQERTSKVKRLHKTYDSLSVFFFFLLRAGELVAVQDRFSSMPEPSGMWSHPIYHNLQVCFLPQRYYEEV